MAKKTKSGRPSTMLFVVALVLLAVAVALLMTAGCTGPIPAESSTREATPVPASDAGVELILEAKARVDVGESLELTLRARNGTNGPVTLFRPVGASWDDLRAPRYSLVWTDESGAPIRDPLGFAGNADCGTLAEPTTEDEVALAPGQVAVVFDSSAPAPTEVLATARPGRYQVELRYVGSVEGTIGEWTETLESQPVPVEVLGGDAEAWACRNAQLQASERFESVTVTPLDLIEDGEGRVWLASATRTTRREPGDSEVSGYVGLVHLDADLQPRAEVLGLDAPIETAAFARGGETMLQVATLRGEGGKERTVLSAVNLGAEPAVVGEPKDWLERPDHATRLAAVALAQRFAVLHISTKGERDALSLTIFDGDAQLLSARQVIGTANELELLADRGDDSLLAVWRRYGGPIKARRFDADGIPLTGTLELEADAPDRLDAAGLVDGGFEVVWWGSLDAGVLASRFGFDGTALGDARRLADRGDAPAAYAWDQGRLIHVDRALSLAGLGTRSADVAPSVRGFVRVAALRDGVALAWLDGRADEAPACTQGRHCSADIWGARLDAQGQLEVEPRQLTHVAKAEPFVPPATQWRAYCDVTAP